MYVIPRECGAAGDAEVAHDEAKGECEEEEDRRGGN